MNAQPRGIRQLPAYMERPYHLVYYLAPGFFSIMYSFMATMLT